MAERGLQTRRQILKLALGGAAGLAFAAPGRALAQSQSGGTIDRLADDLFIIRLPGEAAVVAQSDAQGMLLVDGGSTAGSDALMNGVLPGMPGGKSLHTLFNTHWHPEQTGSNERLGKAGAAIIAHENTRLWTTMDVTWPWNGKKFQKLPKAAQPNKTFYKTGELDGGVRYGYIPDCAHTDGDAYVHFTKQNVLVAGDAVCNDGWPVVDYETGGWIGGMVGGIQRLLAVAGDATRIVPARGPVMTKAELGAQLKMYATINERLVSLLNHGKSPSEAVDAKPTKEFDEKMGNPDEFVRRAFESQWGYLSPDA